MNANSLAMILKIREYRQDTGAPLFFTLDAGPNIHLLYPESIKESVHEFIDKELKKWCYEDKIIHDFVGNGPTIL